MKEVEDSRRIALGISGGIAAYKTAELARLLIQSGYEVLPIMTPWATQFIGPLTLATLTGHRVRVDTPTGHAEEGIEHISLIRSAELLLIAPLTANTLAKMVHGLADNFLTTTYLAHKGATLVCPAMNTAMLDHPATRRNLARLAEDGVSILHGEAGELACGEMGAGRMAEPGRILDRVDQIIGPKLAQIRDKKVLVSAGPTREDLDPVRFLSNRSSGKMGFAIARAFRNAGARVTLVHGPVQLEIPDGLEAISVRSAAQMAEAVLSRQEQHQIVVMAAAVADYCPSKQSHKLKKEAFDGRLELERTTDILATLGERKRPGQLLIGFAAETENLRQNALNKLKRKNLDFIFANDVSQELLGFESDRNNITAFDAKGQAWELGTDDKNRLARTIVSRIALHLAEEKC